MSSPATPSPVQGFGHGLGNGSFNLGRLRTSEPGPGEIHAFPGRFEIIWTFPQFTPQSVNPGWGVQVLGRAARYDPPLVLQRESYLKERGLRQRWTLPKKIVDR